MKKRNQVIDVIKGIGIILVVLGHSGFPFTQYIYMFHMALFFIISGYLYNKNNASCYACYVKYFLKKLRKLWVPFVLVSIFFILFNNIFLDVGLYSKDLYHYFSYEEVVLNLTKSLLWGGGCEMTSTIWFLKILFVVSILYNTLWFILEKESSITSICVSFGLLGTVFSFMKISLPFGLSNIFITVLLFHLGYLIRKYDYIDYFLKKRHLYFFISIVVLTILSLFLNIDLSINQIHDVLSFCISSICGFNIVLYVSWLVSKNRNLSKALSVLGENSIWIMLLHLISFKLCSFIFVCILDLPISKLTSFPYIKGLSGFWLIYTIFGITLPFMIALLFRKPMINFLLRRKKL